MVSFHEGASPQLPDDTLHLHAAMGGTGQDRWVVLYYDRFPGRLSIYLKADEARKLASVMRVVQAGSSTGSD